jgi:hypothetical protein
MKKVDTNMIDHYFSLYIFQVTFLRAIQIIIIA